LSLVSKTLIAGYLYPKLCTNDHVVAAGVCTNVLVTPDTTTAFNANDAVDANDEVPAN
jgi:hypothetical protein